MSIREIILTLGAAFGLLVMAAGANGANQVPQNLSQMTLSFAPLVKQTIPAVVNVYARTKVQSRRFSSFADDPFFRHFFGEDGLGSRRERFKNSLGSGVIVDDQGLVVTNNHVVGGASDIRVVLADKREFDAKILLSDERTDLAVLKIDAGAAPLPSLEFGDSDALEVGDLVLAIGNPFGVGQTVTSGIVSALARTEVGVSDYQFFIQTDAAINPGNSGRRADRHQWPADRHQHGDLLAHRRQHRHRFCHSGQHGQRRGPIGAHGKQGRPALARC